MAESYQTTCQKEQPCKHKDFMRVSVLWFIDSHNLYQWLHQLCGLSCYPLLILSLKAWAHSLSEVGHAPALYHAYAGNHFKVLTLIFRGQQQPNLQYNFSVHLSPQGASASKWKTRKAVEGSSSGNTIAI